MKTRRYLQFLSNASDLVKAGHQTGLVLIPVNGRSSTGRYVPKRIVTPGFRTSA